MSEAFVGAIHASLLFFRGRHSLTEILAVSIGKVCEPFLSFSMSEGVVFFGNARLLGCTSDSTERGRWNGEDRLDAFGTWCSCETWKTRSRRVKTMCGSYATKGLSKCPTGVRIYLVRPMKTSCRYRLDEQYQFWVET